MPFSPDWWKGRKQSHEHIAKRMAGSRGRIVDPATIAKILATKRARGTDKPTPETRAKMSAAHRGRKKSPAHVAKIAAANTTHGATVGHDKGMRRMREYRAWCDVKTRCFNPRRPQWKDYGGRGITMASVWRDSFEQFYADMGPCPPGLTIDRIDNDGHYEPGNCRWTSRDQQTQNRRPARGYTSGG